MFPCTLRLDVVLTCGLRLDASRQMKYDTIAVMQRLADDDSWNVRRVVLQVCFFVRVCVQVMHFSNMRICAWILLHHSDHPH